MFPGRNKVEGYAPFNFLKGLPGVLLYVVGFYGLDLTIILYRNLICLGF